MPDYEKMSLDEFISQPDTVDFAYDNSSRFRKYIEDKPYIKVGTILGAGGSVVAYTKRAMIEKVFKDLGSDYLTFYPQLLSPLGMVANNAAGIYQARRQQSLELRGRGVAIGFVDTGIDYTKPAFRYEDGSTKIRCLWDQTLSGNPPENIRFGTVYNREDIDKALDSEHPASVVPSSDTDGHGTFLASVAAGRENNEYMGAAPDAEIIAVKLRPAHAYHTERLNFSGGAQTRYASTDFMLGIKFILDRAGEANMPVVVCIGMGSTFGGHNGDTLLERYISGVTQRTGIACVAAAGNEGNMRHHAEGRIPAQGESDSIPINMREDIRNVAFHVSSEVYDKIAVEVVSPAGETTGRLTVRPDNPYVHKLALEDATITVRYYEGSSNVALIAIQNPTPGIWNVLLHGDSILGGGYHAWLPLTGVVNPGVEFLKPSPNYTIVMPATAERIICVGAYNQAETSLYVSSSWGPTARSRMAPDFVAPGVNVKGVYPTGYGAMTGTSAAAAVTAGACAMLMEWGIINGKERSMGQERIRALLISGCTRRESITFPNTQWGFGTLNLLNVFEGLRG